MMPAVKGFDVNRFMRKRAPLWEQLERMLLRVDQQGLRSLDLATARRFGNLYRTVSSDLIRARTELVDASLTDYLNDLVARAYSHIYAGSGQRRGRRIWSFFAHEFPRLFRREWKVVALSAAILLSGAGLGAVFTAIDPDAQAVLIPDGHREHTPQERVADEELSGGNSDANEAAAFSSFLFTHNIKVTFLVFALGITLGIGTVSVLFYNGIPLGALAMQYHMSGQGLFFWAWILPHGIPELSVVVIAGGAGLMLARGLLMPGRLRRKDAVVREARQAARLVVGGMPLLVLAGVIEGTISQVHEPTIPYAVKLVFAALVGTGVYAYLLFAGRRTADGDAEQTDEPAW